jgi:hypothetical protein
MAHFRNSAMHLQHEARLLRQETPARLHSGSVPRSESTQTTVDGRHRIRDSVQQRGCLLALLLHDTHGNRAPITSMMGTVSEEEYPTYPVGVSRVEPHELERQRLEQLSRHLLHVSCKPQDDGKHVLQNLDKARGI